MYTMPAPTVRLLLLKSGAGSGAKIAHMPGFAFWGGRWHKVAHDKPAPKHAPLAHHPKAAGHFEPVAHLTQEQWDALKLPESNTNAPTFNKQLQTVKELSESGNVTALLGLGVGSNTYGVKLSKIINHLLGLHGSPHAVSPGQKPGTHAATLNADPAAPHPSGLPDHIAPKVAEPVDPGFSTPPVSHYQVDPQQYGSWAFIKPGVGKSFTHEDKQVLIAWFKSTGWYANITEDGRVFVKPKSGASLEDIPVSPNQAAKLKKDKDKFEAEKKAKAEKAASDSALNSTDQFSYVEQSLGGNANAYTKKALAKYLIDGGKFDGIYGGWINHLKLAGIDVGDGSPKAAAAGLKAAYQNSVVGAAGSSTSKPTEAAHAEGDKWVMPLDAAVAEHKELVAAAESPSKADDKAVLAEQKAELGKLEAAQAAGPLAMPAFEEGKTTTTAVDYYTAIAQKVMNMAAAGDAAGLEAMKADGMKPNAKGKISNTWAGKTANSKKFLALHAAALAHAGGGGAKPGAGVGGSFVSAKITSSSGKHKVAVTGGNGKNFPVVYSFGSIDEAKDAAAVFSLSGADVKPTTGNADSDWSAYKGSKVGKAVSSLFSLGLGSDSADEFLPFLDVKNAAGRVALDAYISGQFHDINAKPDHAVSKALIDYVESLPGAGFSKLHRVVHFDDKSDLDEFLATLKPGALNKQDRTVTSWTANDYKDANAQLGQGGQFAAMMSNEDHVVHLTLEGKNNGKDISFAYENGEVAGDDVVLPIGSVIEVQSVKKSGKDVFISVRQVQDGDTKPGANGGMLVLKNGRWVKAPAPAVAPEPVVPAAQPTPAPRLVLPKKASAVPEPAKPKLPPHLVSLAAKMSGSQPGATVTDVTPAGYGPEPGPKEGDTKPAADGGTLVLKDGHWVKQGGDAAPVAQATQAAPAAQAPTGPLSAEQLSNLQSIPWYKLKLPDSNSNAKSHNAAVAKIEAMAFAGDVAGLKAFADKKAGAKQTYAKKQHLLAMSALDFLSGSGPTTEQKVRAAKVAAQPEPVVEAAQAVEPAAAPAPQPVADQASADSVPAYPKKMIDDYAASGDWSGVQMIIDNSPTPSVVAYAKQVLAGKPTPKPTRLVSAKPPASLPDKLKAAGFVVGVAANGKTYLYNDAGDIKDHADKTQAENAVAKLSRAGFDAHVVGLHPYPVIIDGEKDENTEPPAAPDIGPKEGDTKQGADGMLVFKNGHWVKVEGDKPNAKAIVATVPMPKLGGGNGKIKFTQKMKELKAIAEQDGAAGLSKVVSFSPSGHVKIKGYKSINPSGSVYGKNAEAMAQYAKALHEAVVGAGAVGTPAAAPAPGTPTPAPATPTPPPTVNGLPSMDNWVQTGQQGGSNPGGKFKDPSGQEWYCKWPDDAEAAKSEVLAAKLYALAGLSSQDCMLVSKGGKTAIATKWVNIQKAPSPSALAAADGALAGFAVDAWLGNWDVVGLAFDNLQIGPDGKAHRVDAGGSLEYRAQGEKKPFGPKVDELETLRDAGKNAQAAAVFKGMTKADMTASAAKVLAISDVAIRAMVNQYGPGDAAAKAKLAETLIARKKDIAAKFPEAAKKKKAPTFKPEDISAPPSFLNWGGPGKSGPSSKEFLNKANEAAVQAIFAAAKTGSVEAVKSLTAPVFDKNTGVIAGYSAVLTHPSQHVSGYAQQSINELNYQLNPPKQYRFDGGHPLHSLNAAYPSHKGAPSSAVAQKLGKFIMLGEPGVIALADLGLPAKITHAEGGGTLSVHTYAKQAQAAIAKMPATQKQAIKSYTGSQYHAMNGSLWDGNPTGAAKAAGEALKTLGHDIEPGTILSRQVSLHGQDLNDILGSVGKMIQEPAIMSTSIRPSSWVRNVQFKLHVGPGVKGLWVGYNSLPGGGALSINASEDEMVLPPGTRLFVLSVRKGGKDEDGFGAHGQQHVIEAIIMPTE